LVEQYLKSLNAPPSQKAIAYDDPKKFRFKPPGTTYPSKYIKGDKAKFKRQSPGVKEALDPISYAAGGAAMLIASTLVNWAHKKYMEIYGKANEACGKLKGNEGRLCRQNYKVQAAKAEIQALKFARSKCRRAKDPKVCVQKLNAKVKELTNKHPDIEYTMKAISKHKQESRNVVDEVKQILLGRE
jgi:hypothetical protein